MAKSKPGAPVESMPQGVGIPKCGSGPLERAQWVLGELAGLLRRRGGRSDKSPTDDVSAERT